MWKVSKEYLEAVKKPSRNIKCKIEIGEITINEEDIIDFSIDRSLGNGDIPGIGGVISAKLELNLVRSSKLPEFIKTLKIKPYVAIGEWVLNKETDILEEVFNFMPLGVFRPYTESVKKTEQSVSVECYDMFYHLDKERYTTNLTYPTSVLNVATELANKAGCSINKENISGTVNMKMEVENARIALSDLCELSGTNAIMDREDIMTFPKIVNTGKTLTADNYIKFELLSDDAITIDKIVLDVGGEEDPIISGAAKNNGFIISNANITNQSELDNVYNKAFPLSYYAYELVCQGMPHFDVYDKINLIDVKGVNRELILVNHTLIYNGGLRSEFVAQVPSDTDTPTGSKGNNISSEGDYEKMDTQWGTEADMNKGTGDLYNITPDANVLGVNYIKKDRPIVSTDRYYSNTDVDPRTNTTYQIKTIFKNDKDDIEKKGIEFHLLVGKAGGIVEDEILYDFIPDLPYAGSGVHYSRNCSFECSLANNNLYIAITIFAYCYKRKDDINKEILKSIYETKIFKYNIVSKNIINTRTIRTGEYIFKGHEIVPQLKLSIYRYNLLNNNTTDRNYNKDRVVLMEYSGIYPADNNIGNNGAKAELSIFTETSENSDLNLQKTIKLNAIDSRGIFSTYLLKNAIYVLHSEKTKKKEEITLSDYKALNIYAFDPLNLEKIGEELRTHETIEYANGGEISIAPRQVALDNESLYLIEAVVSNIDNNNYKEDKELRMYKTSVTNGFIYECLGELDLAKFDNNDRNYGVSFLSKNKNFIIVIPTNTSLRVCTFFKKDDGTYKTFLETVCNYDSLSKRQYIVAFYYNVNKQILNLMLTENRLYIDGTESADDTSKKAPMPYNCIISTAIDEKQRFYWAADCKTLFLNMDNEFVPILQDKNNTTGFLGKEANKKQRFYWATDTKKLFLNMNGRFTAILKDTNNLAKVLKKRPKKKQRFFWATDTKTLFLNMNNEFVAILQDK